MKSDVKIRRREDGKRAEYERGEVPVVGGREKGECGEAFGLRV